MKPVLIGVQIAAVISAFMAGSFQIGRMYEGINQLHDCVRIIGGTRLEDRK